MKKIITILVMMLLIASTVISIANETNIENNSTEELNEEIENDVSSSKAFFPNIPRILNRDWNYWKNKPDLFLISTGNVGIGTESPREKLDVAGTVQMMGIKMPTDASDGYVMTCDALGVGSWQPASGGGIGGSGTTGFIPKFVDSTTIGDSLIYESGINVGIGTENPTEELDVDGDLKVRNNLTVDNYLSVKDDISAGNVWLRNTLSAKYVYAGFELHGQGIYTNIVTIENEYSISSWDHTIIAKTGLDTYDILLPSCSYNEGQMLIIKQVGTMGGVNVVADENDHIDGYADSKYLDGWKSITIQSDGDDWWILSSYP